LLVVLDVSRVDAVDVGAVSLLAVPVVDHAIDCAFDLRSNRTTVSTSV
jgi:hypothetical protein